MFLTTEMWVRLLPVQQKEISCVTVRLSKPEVGAQSGGLPVSTVGTGF